MFSNLFKKKLHRSDADVQAVLVYLDAANLPEEANAQEDLAGLEDKLKEVIEDQQLGEFDGNQVGEGEAILFMYGPDAEALFLGIEPILQDFEVCDGAKVVIRSGPPGSLEREVAIEVDKPRE